MTFLNTRAPGGHRLCSFLRAKEMYYTSQVRAENDDSWVADAADDNNHYFCLKTCRNEAPDGQGSLSMEECGPDRPCYEP